jgi:hypothetical protein
MFVPLLLEKETEIIIYNNHGRPKSKSIKY